MSTLERAICIAAMAHIGQKDKGGAAHILHPLRLMMKMSTEEEQIVAVLHDVVEDSHGPSLHFEARALATPFSTQSNA
jgi:(p)ppGpp synthase/HD superfamily hydrolase